MSPRAVISVDLMGGDGGPRPLLSGLAWSASRNPNLSFILFGPQSELRPLLRRRRVLAGRCEIRDCPDVVAMEDQPSRTLRERRSSSMWRALEAVRDGEARVCVSAGNTGALLAMSVFLLRKSRGVARPAIAVQWPAERPEGYNIVLDVGADLRADPDHLAQYAVMGAEYARVGLGYACPKVGLLNLGTEETKGPENLRDAARQIAEAEAKCGGRFAYVGFVEGGDLPGRRADVIVTDGFTGNIALKTAEGTAGFIRRALKEAFRATLWSRIGMLFAIRALGRLRKRIDPRRVNGGVFLGLNGTVVKSHGSADAVGFASAVDLAAKIAASDFTGQVAAELEKLDIVRAGGERGSGSRDG